MGIVPPTVPDHRRFYCHETKSHPNKLLKGLQLHFKEHEDGGFECVLKENLCTLEITVEFDEGEDLREQAHEVKVLVSGYKSGDEMPEDYIHEDLTGSFLLDVQMNSGFTPNKQSVFEDVL